MLLRQQSCPPARCSIAVHYFRTLRLQSTEQSRRQQRPSGDSRVYVVRTADAEAAAALLAPDAFPELAAAAAADAPLEAAEAAAAAPPAPAEAAAEAAAPVAVATADAVAEAAAEAAAPPPPASEPHTEIALQTPILFDPNSFKAKQIWKFYNMDAAICFSIA